MKNYKRYVCFKNITVCSLAQQLKVREIRNKEAVRVSMYTDHEIGVNEHLQWINRLKSDKKQIIFAVLDDAEMPVGVVGVNAIDGYHKKADWSFYLDVAEYGNGLGAALEYFLLDFLFEKLNLEKLNCEVIEINETVVRLHKKFGFVEEGFRRQNVEKNGKRIGVYFLGLTKSDWNINKINILEKYQCVLDKFEIRIDESDVPADSLLTLIETARARNNLNWMALLRLCIERHPETAKPIVSEILRLDTEILELTKKLVS